MTTDTDTVLEQPPAADKDGEASVLGACMPATPAYDPVADAVRINEPGDWYRLAHKTVWAAIIRLHGRSQPTGLPMVVAELSSTGDLERIGGRVALSRMVEAACSSGEVEHYAALVHGYAKVRALQAALGRGLQMARQTAPDTVTHTVRTVQTELDFLAAGGEADRHFGRLGDDLHAHLESLETTEVAAAVTGLVDLDDVLMMLAGNVIVVAGRPGMGKSALTLGIAVANAGTGRPTLVHSMEMGRREVNNPILAARSRGRLPCRCGWTTAPASPPAAYATASRPSPERPASHLS